MSAVSIDEPLAGARATPPPSRLLLAISLSLVLGGTVLALVFLAMAWQERLPQAPRLLADAAGLLTWATVTGAALAIGQALARGRTAVAATVALGGAALAFLLARSVQIAVLSALTGSSIHGATPWLGAGLHGVEFALLAALVAWQSRRHAGAWRHVLAGALLGGLTFAASRALLPPVGDALPLAVAEVGVPAAVILALVLAGRIATRPS